VRDGVGHTSILWERWYVYFAEGSEAGWRVEREDMERYALAVK